MKWIEKTKNYIKKCQEKNWAKKRYDDILSKCGCVCYCPSCKDILNDQADCTDTDLVRYTCTCGTKSEWNFDICPFPVIIRVNGGKARE
jgi:hypothetical protein